MNQRSSTSFGNTLNGEKLRSSSTPFYTELEVTTNFSFLRGASHPEEIIEQAALLGYSALGVADYHTLSGVVRAHLAAKEFGVKLLIGARLELFESIPIEDLTAPLITVLAYAISQKGYANLASLLTVGKRRAPKGKCYLSIADLLSYNSDIVIIVPQRNLTISPNFLSALKSIKKTFSEERCSLALTRRYQSSDHRLFKTTLELSRNTSLPLVATNDVRFHVPERKPLHDVLTCTQLGCTLKEAGFALLENAEGYLKSPAEINRLFKEYPEAIKRSQFIAEQLSSFSLDELRYHYPRETTPNGKEPQEYLTDLTWSCAKSRYPEGVPQNVINQIRYELTLIAELNYAKYFLTVYDIVEFARSRGILCQGRGAAANSAVCFCLGITAVDPARVNILFERFISKERNEPPDIDIDFEHERREEVIQYIYNKYGRDRAALVCEFITYRRKSAVRDVGKAFGLSHETLSMLSTALKTLDVEGIGAAHLQHANLNIEHKTAINILTLANTLVGFPRHLSQHVGGFVISDNPLHEIVPIENAAMENRTVIEWDKNDIDALGFLKIDILGLGMLTCVRKCIELINKSVASSSLAFHSVPAEDPKVYDMICRADTVGVFQIESRAQMSMLPRLKPRSYYDLVIEVAIVRPGPIQGNMIHPYIRRRSGKEQVAYPDKKVQTILSRTLGIPLFQEQTMALAVACAGFSPGESDKLRRAISSWNSKPALVKELTARFRDGMLSNGYNISFVETCLEHLKAFSEYGFPESHAASFALIVYVSAWLKEHYPAHFACALLNSQPMGFYAPAQIVNDLTHHGFPVLPIDVNASLWDCTIERRNQTLRLGFRLINGLGEEEIASLLETRAKLGRFNSITQIWKQTKASVVTLRKLALADAFLSLGLPRREALWEIRKFHDKPLPLFVPLEKDSPTKAALPPPELKDIVLEDYRYTTLSLKAHPALLCRPMLAAAGALTSIDLQDSRRVPNKSWVIVGGIVVIRQRPPTAHGMLFITLEDESGIMNIVVRPEILERYRIELLTSSFLVVQGQVERAEGVINIRAERVYGRVYSAHD